jgi:hypothetical protein
LVLGRHKQYCQLALLATILLCIIIIICSANDKRKSEAKWVFPVQQAVNLEKIANSASSNSYIVKKIKTNTLLLKLKLVKYNSILNWKY